MSDTDDTDDLLLIPPDLFIVQSDSEENTKPYGPYYKVVDCLITQVNKLEDRINSIETSSDSNLLNSSLDYFLDNNPQKTNLMSSFRKYNSWEDIPKPEGIYTASTRSTPQKPRSKFKPNSLPSTPSTERHSPGRSRLNIATSNAQYGESDRTFFPLPSHNTQLSLQNSITNVQVPQNKDVQPRRAQNEMLNEIDSFIANVKTIQKYNVARNLNSQFDTYRLNDKKRNPISKDVQNSSDTTNAGLKLVDVDQVLQAMESQQREIESRLKERELELAVNRSMVKEPELVYKEETWRQGETKGSVPDRGMGMRDILYGEEDYKESLIENNRALPVTALNSQEPSSSDLSARHNSESVYSDNSPSISSSDLTQRTAYQNQNVPNNTRERLNISSDSDKIQSHAMQVLNMHKTLLSRNTVRNPSSGESIAHKHEKLSLQNSEKNSAYSLQNEFEAKSSDYELSRGNKLALLSLTDLWSQTGSDVRIIDHSKFVNKLQEEKLRRQHCEQLIKELQTCSLELQERLAVAIQVDRAKDEAILRVHKSWEEAAAKIDSVNNEKSNLEQQITELKARISVELTEATKKVNHYESESSKALNLAHNNQEKSVSLERQNVLLTTELESCQNKLKTLQDNYNIELDNNRQFSKIVGQKEMELNENKNTLTEARKEVAQSKRAVEICQTELTSMKTTQSQLESQIKEDLEQMKKLKIENSRLLVDIETHKKIEKTLQDDLNKQKDANDQNKVELRNFYQDQVEVVVRDKLREFQSQLEKAENSLQDEIRSRELSIAKAAALHIHQITEKHTLEVHLLEEKHKEEVKLNKLQLTQAQQKIEDFHVKFQQQQERRAYIAQQLHKVMEAQWLEAIKIINNGKSPIVSQDKSTNTIDQLNSLKSKSYNNLEEILFKEDNNKGSGDQKPQRTNMPFLQRIDSASSMIEDDFYHKIAPEANQDTAETPLTSRPQKNRQQIENELQKYVQMLLNKSPGNPTDEKSKNPSPDSFQWLQSQNLDGTKSSKISLRDRSGKPPWK